MTYAARYPDQVAGMVLLDSSSPQQFTALPDYPGTYAIMHRVLGVLPALTRLGVPENEAQVYSEAVRRGGVLLVSQVDDSHTSEVAGRGNRFTT